MKNVLLLLLLPFTLLAQKQVVVHINTDSWPSETRWVLHVDSLNGPILGDVNYGHYTTPNTTYTDTLYISDSLTNITFVIYDSYGDGLQPPGSYFVSICEDTIIDYPNPSFTTGLISNRIIPPCNGPPMGPCVPAVLNINLDQFQSETTWEIHDSAGVLLYAGGPYSMAPNYQPQFENVCLPPGEVTLTMYDSYGDGLAGSLWGGLDGSYYLTQCGDTIVFGDVPNFGTDTSHVFVSDTCIPPPPLPGCMDPLYVEYNPLADTSDGSCITLAVLGCTDSTMFNYDSIANTMNTIDSCNYILVLHDLMGNGWIESSLKLYAEDTTEYYNSGGFNDIYNISLKAPIPITFQFFITAQANLTTIECGFTLINPEGDTIISIQPPFIQPLFQYNAITNCGNICIEKVFGCPDTLSCNYTSGVNTPTSCTYPVTYYNCNNECIFDADSDGVCNELEIVGCQDPLMFNYNILATDSGLCEPFIYGCTDPLMYNYDITANTDNGNCEPFIYGCTDSTMFNFNPLANADNNTCIPIIYGCTDPSALNYNPSANSEDFSCISYMYGCTDSSALNFDSLANTDNGSCVETVEGCMDQTAYNYSGLVNSSDSASCLYSANCITGDSIPYWLNDPCYAWVIEVDEYCCDNEWDEICQLTYNHCEGGWPLPPARIIDERKLIRITDVLGREIKETKNVPLFYIYNDGSVEKRIITNKIK